jgi:serine/threonine protein phosphatase PrpC
MRYEFHALSDVGLVRTNNEDAVLHDSRLGLALLADGMGGHNAGEVASSMALESIETDFSVWLATGGREADSASITHVMRDCAAHANNVIFNAARAEPALAGMGTTLVFCVFLPERIFVGNTGDSRCYRWRRGTLERLTRDHSLVQEYVDAGLITEQQAVTAPFRGQLTRALGVDPDVVLDIEEHQPEAGDVYLVCSDGVTDMLDDARIAALLAPPALSVASALLAQHASNTQPIEGLAARLIDAANKAGGRDNASVVLIRASVEQDASNA